MSALPSPLKSRCPTIAHGLAAEPGEPPPITLVPFTSHTTACPLVVLYQRTSLLQSSLKSWLLTRGMHTAVPVEGIPLATRSEEHTSELQSRFDLGWRPL